LKLGARTFQVAEVKQSLQPAGQILCAAANQGDDLVGTQKPVPVDEPEYVVVALRQLDRRNFNNTLEAWKSVHHASMMRTRSIHKTCGIVYSGKPAVVGGA